MNRLLLGAALALMAGASGGVQAADVVRGGELFATYCSECHSVKEGKNKKGPHLFALIGRPAASVEGVVYSDALKASQLVWNDKTISPYIANPRKYLPGGKMKFDGVDDASEREAIIAYLTTLKK